MSSVQSRSPAPSHSRDISVVRAIRFWPIVLAALCASAGSIVAHAQEQCAAGEQRCPNGSCCPSDTFCGRGIYGKHECIPSTSERICKRSGEAARLYQLYEYCPPDDACIVATADCGDRSGKGYCCVSRFSPRFCKSSSKYCPAGTMCTDQNDCVLPKDYPIKK